MSREEESRTAEEFERALNATRYATIHDLVNSAGFRELSKGSRPTRGGSTESSSGDRSELPNRR